jgi:hypothetical protein
MQLKLFRTKAWKMESCWIKHNAEITWPSVTLSFKNQIFPKEKTKMLMSLEEKHFLSGFSENKEKGPWK